jgi:predicted RNA-binding Zn-ribbon protein involved in translation (DUF1610 family)
MSALCPECGEEMAYLNVYEKRESKTYLSVENHRVTLEYIEDYRSHELYEDTGSLYEIECPECGESLFNGDLERAKNHMLRGMPPSPSA